MSLDHLALLRSDLDQFVDAIEHGPLDAPIAGCPGWVLADLGAHLGGVHRWVLAALATGAAPAAGTVPPAPAEPRRALAPWLREGSVALLEALEALDPDAPTWHPFPVEPKRAGLWRRRQAQEASVHRWDAQRAIGMTPHIDAAIAEDGVDEYWTVMLSRMLLREQRRTPATRLAITLTDTGGRWTIDGSSGLPVAGPGDADAVLEGDAESMLLRLWGRPAGEIGVHGDADVAAEWLALGGA